jgi:hypothetical protein
MILNFEQSAPNGAKGILYYAPESRMGRLFDDATRALTFLIDAQQDLT